MSDKTHMLAFLNDLLIGVGRTHQDLQKVVESEIVENNLLNSDGNTLQFDECRIVEDVVLTDEKPDDEDHIIFESGNEGWILDEYDDIYHYAVSS